MFSFFHLSLCDGLADCPGYTPLLPLIAGISLKPLSLALTRSVWVFLLVKKGGVHFQLHFNTFYCNSYKLQLIVLNDVLIIDDVSYTKFARKTLLLLISLSNKMQTKCNIPC